MSTSRRAGARYVGAASEPRTPLRKTKNGRITIRPYNFLLPPNAKVDFIRQIPPALPGRAPAPSVDGSVLPYINKSISIPRISPIEFISEMLSVSPSKSCFVNSSSFLFIRLISAYIL